ncbi:MAG: hypothetical protein LBP54_03580 [Campylobacteraceae bacterium]|jgi:hypothetical protein|nr:hypothetical protein [Campylobacteraceae bacterium]
MIIIGYKLVDFTPFHTVKKAEEIIKSPVIFEFSEENFALFRAICKKKEIVFSVETNSVKEALLANAAGASYIVAKTKKAAKKIQRIAEYYLFDAKILLKIKDENEIEKAAKSGIDGVLLPNGVIDGSF